ncbi:MAG: hypothetical protein ACRC28_12840 [Clostridium sp.]|uniref:hypothetical protein n=1 Tax=Clostridium sp. TaxID=1506 RepID=UPI003F2A7E61
MKKKKEGIALIWVLMISTVLLIVGTGIMYFVMNSQKIDVNLYNKSNANAILKSEISFGENNILKNNKEYKEEAVGTVKSLNYNMFGTTGNVVIEKLQNEVYKITGSTVYENVSYSMTGSLALTFKGDKIIRKVNNFIKNNSSLTTFSNGVNILGYSSWYEIDTKFYLNNTYANIKAANGYNSAYLNNMAWNNLGGNDYSIDNVGNLENVPKIKGLDLALGKGTLNLNQGGEPIIGWFKFSWSKDNLDYYEESLNRTDMILFNKTGTVVRIDKNDLGKINLKNYIGILVKVQNGYALINNGDININGNVWTRIFYQFLAMRKSIFMYSTGKITLNKAPMYLKNSSLISDDGINFNYSSFYDEGYFKINDELDSILLKITK